jgi:hypothetical protein
MFEQRSSAPENSPEMMQLDFELHNAIALNRDHIQRITDQFGIERDQLTLYPDESDAKSAIVLSAVGSKGDQNSLEAGTPIALYVQGKRKDPTTGSYRYYSGNNPFLHTMDQHPQITNAYQASFPTHEIAAQLADKLQSASSERPAVQKRTSRLLGKLGLIR